MADDRLIELAIKGLEVEKARIEKELAELRNQRNGRAMKAAAPSTHGAPSMQARARKKTWPHTRRAQTAVGTRATAVGEEPQTRQEHFVRSLSIICNPFLR